MKKVFFLIVFIFSLNLYATTDSLKEVPFEEHSFGELPDQDMKLSGTPEELFRSIQDKIPSVRKSEENEYKKIIVCSTEMSGLHMELEFFREIDIKTQEATGFGYFAQIMFGIPFEGRIQISSEDQKESITMFVVGEPNFKFATFVIPTSKEFKVEIYSESFEETWGKFDCLKSE
jgi:hypothetical protein